MKTAVALLACAAMMATTSASFVITDECASGTFDTPTSEWKCFLSAFGGSKGSRQVMPFTVSEDANLQVIIANYKSVKVGTAAGTYTWNFGTDYTTPFYFVSPGANVPDNAGPYDSHLYTDSTWNVKNVWQKPGSTVAASTVYTATTEEEVCAGNWMFIANSTETQPSASVEYALMYRVVPKGASGLATMLPTAGSVEASLTDAITATTSSAVVNALFPGASVQFYVDEDFAKYRYMIDGLKVTVVTDSGSFVTTDSTWSIDLPSGFTQNNNTQITWNGNSKTFMSKEDPKYESTNTFSHEWWHQIDYTGAAATSNPAYITVNLPTLADEAASEGFGNDGYNWASNSIFWDITVTLTSLTEYPWLYNMGSVSTQSNVVLDAREASEGKLDEGTPIAVYMVRMNNLWWNFRPTFTSVVDQLRTDNPLEGSNLMFKVQKAGLTDATCFMDACESWADSDTTDVDGYSYTTNTAFYTSGTGMVVNTAPAPVSAYRNTMYFVAVYAGRDTTCMTEYVDVGSIGFETSTVVDECASYAECATGDDNPAEDRAEEFSANSDTSRFSRCVVAATDSSTFAGKQVPATKCYECGSDSECGESQYCYVPNLWCSTTLSGGATYRYICNEEGLGPMYTCRDKSTDVLGKKCRPGATATAVTSGSAPTLFDQNVVEGNTDDSFATGYGYCGEVLYYNASNPLFASFNADSGKVISPGGLVWQTLWSGECVNHMCYECAPGSYSQGSLTSSKACVNGRYVAGMDVDGTVRSFTENTLAGTQLGGTMMIVLLIGIFMIYMLGQARRHRELMGDDGLGCCAVLCCCGTFSSAERPGKSTTNPVAAMS